MKELAAKHRVLLLQLGVALICTLALLRQFPSVKDFVAAIDHGDVPGGDFVFHYYPTARNSIREGAPAVIDRRDLAVYQVVAESLYLTKARGRPIAIVTRTIAASARPRE